MPKIRVFDPAAPTEGPDRARFAADLEWLQKQGVKVERFDAAANPAAFAETPAVKDALARGEAVLPLVLLDERVATEGKYPSRETLAALAGVVLRRLDVAPSSGCCGGGAEPTPKGKTSCC